MEEAGLRKEVHVDHHREEQHKCAEVDHLDNLRQVHLGVREGDEEEARRRADLRFGRVVVSEIEVPNMLVNLV